MKLTWLPNALTLSRWLIAPFVLVFALSGHWWVSAGLLYWAAFSDMIDGTLARWIGVANSEFGRQLDRYGDLILVTFATIGLMASHWTPIFLWVFLVGYISMIVLELGKRFFPKKTLRYRLCSQALLLYYLGLFWILIILFSIKANGGLSFWMVIVVVILTIVAFALKKSRVKAS